MYNIPDGAISPLFRLCKGNHERQIIEGKTPGHGARSKISEVYPWRFCRHLARLVCRFLYNFDDVRTRSFLSSLLEDYASEHVDAFYAYAQFYDFGPCPGIGHACFLEAFCCQHDHSDGNDE